MPLVLSLTLAAGVLLIYLSATADGKKPDVARGESLSARLDGFLRQATLD